MSSRSARKSRYRSRSGGSGDRTQDVFSNTVADAPDAPGGKHSPSCPKRPNATGPRVIETRTMDIAGSPIGVDIRTSQRRAASSNARMVAGRLVITVPELLTFDERETAIAGLVAKVQAKLGHSNGPDLVGRARQLSGAYLGGVECSSIVWSANQKTLWGSCSTQRRSIRISDQLMGAPAWVLDAVILHELAHLIVPDHDADFYNLVNRYEHTKAADHYLEGYSHGLGLAISSDDAGL
jgi:hypothetical protein